MHKKSFTFGVGVGILFVTGLFYFIISLIEPQVVVEEVTRELFPDEIVQLARDLGYTVTNTDQNLEDEFNSENLLTDSNFNIENENDYTEIPNLNDESTYQDELLIEEETQQTESVVIQIQYATPAFVVAQILYQHNIIDDPAGFTQFLINGGYANRLRAGFLTFQVNSTFNQALDVLTSPD